MKKKNVIIYILVIIIIMLLAFSFYYFLIKDRFDNNEIEYIPTTSRTTTSTTTTTVITKPVESTYVNFYYDGTYTVDKEVIDNNTFYSYKCDSFDICKDIKTVIYKNPKGDKVLIKYKISYYYEILYDIQNKKLLGNYAKIQVEQSSNKRYILYYDDSNYSGDFSKNGYLPSSCNIIDLQNNTVKRIYGSNKFKFFSFSWKFSEKNNNIFIFLEQISEAGDGPTKDILALSIDSIYSVEGKKLYMRNNVSESEYYFASLVDNGFVIVDYKNDNSIFNMYDKNGNLKYSSKNYNLLYPIDKYIVAVDNNNINILDLKENIIKTIGNINIANITNSNHTFESIEMDYNKNLIIVRMYDDIDINDEKIRKELYEDFKKSSYFSSYSDDVYSQYEHFTESGYICGYGIQYEYNYKTNESNKRYIVIEGVCP